MGKKDVLTINNLNVNLMTTNGILYALQGINLSLKAGEVHGIVGESGSGKSMTVKSIMRLHDSKKTEYEGEIVFHDKNLLELHEKDMQKIRGKDISMIFQDPMISLDPIMKIGKQITEMLKVKEKLSKEEAKVRTIQLFQSVGIEPAEKRFDQYPFELSGGLLQRVMICMAIAAKPEILIADEPTTALDVTIQAQILKLLKELQEETQMSILFVTHNLGVVAEICDHVSVVYGGRVMEDANVIDIFDKPLHPYTKALLASSPNKGKRGEKMVTIPGEPPKLFKKLQGCPFAPRCEYAAEKCFVEVPELEETAERHHVACHRVSGI